MPKASAPNAPCVAVCESPQTIVMPGWVRPSCGPITCTMPWLLVAQRVQPDAELGAVAAQRLDLRARGRVGDREQVAAAGVERRVGVPGRGVVVLGRERQVGPPHRAAGQPQAVEGLRAGHLVQQVQVDVEQVRLAVGGPHHVGVPDLLGQGPRLTLARSDSHHLDILNSGRYVSACGTQYERCRRSRQGGGHPRGLRRRRQPGRTRRADQAAAGHRAPAGAGAGDPPDAGPGHPGPLAARARASASWPTPRPTCC